MQDSRWVRAIFFGQIMMSVDGVDRCRSFVVQTGGAMKSTSSFATDIIPANCRSRSSYLSCQIRNSYSFSTYYLCVIWPFNVPLGSQFTFLDAVQLKLSMHRKVHTDDKIDGLGDLLQGLVKKSSAGPLARYPLCKPVLNHFWGLL